MPGSEFIFATGNNHKAAEVLAALGGDFQLTTLRDLGFEGDIPETGTTLRENAFIKASAVFQMFNRPCFADDTGLEVTALNGAPGVYSARYAGPDASFEDNCNLLLQNLMGKSNRSAAFTTVFCLMLSETQVYYFEGRVDGTITETFRGRQGFGYDPLFLPDGSSLTFAEMDLAAKNEMSHRSRALKQMALFLKELQQHD